MDPIQNALASLLNALQAASAAPPPDVAAPQLPALLALVGQDVNLLFLGAGPDGSQLALPSGQVFTAQGGLPYPDGTELLVRILGGAAEAGSLRLQTLEARPPAPAPILAPLLQGEGAALLGRLGRPDPGPGLAPLAELYETLQPPQAGPAAADLPGRGAPPAPQPSPALQAAPGPQPPAGAAAAPAAPASPMAPVPASLPPAGSGAHPAALALPDPLQLQAAVDRLPAPVAAALKAILPSVPGGSALAALETWLADASANLPPGRPAVPELLQRFQALLDRHPELPPAPAAALQPFLKALVGERRPAAPEPAPRPQGPSPSLLAAARSGPELPETWQSWIRAAVRTLSDPAVSPREAPFHAAQAKEGTAFYELPLPWAPQTPLQVWVESDRKGREGGGQDETRTVLVGLKFTRLGETRLGVAKGPAGLQVRVWTEHPELLASATEAMEKELGALGPAVDLKILPLRPGPGGFVPSLRSLVTGPTMQMLG